MKKSLSLFFTLMVVIILSGCHITTGYVYANSDQYAVGNTQCEVDTIQKIDVSWISGDVNVVGSDQVTNVRVSEEVDAGTEERYQMHYWLNNGTLYIKFAESMSSFTHLYHIKELNILVPTTFDKNILINSTSANTSISEIQSDLTLHSVSGIITLTDIESTTCNIDNVSGKLQMENVIFDTCDINLTSGNITALTSEITHLNLNAVSSSISLSLLIAPSSCEIDTVSGNINLTLPSSANFVFTFDKVSGSVNSEFALTINANVYTVGVGGPEYEFNTVSGSLHLKKLS